MTLPRLPQTILFHGKEDLPNGNVLRLENLLRASFPNMEFARPLIPSWMSTSEAIEFVKTAFANRIKTGSFLVGIGRGGLIACALQSAFPALHLSVVAVNSPTRERNAKKEIIAQASPCQNSYSRMALYSSAYLPMENDWHLYAPLHFDVSWLSKGVVFYPIAYLISAFLGGRDMEKEVSNMFPPSV
jgi:hypothetical protein